MGTEETWALNDEIWPAPRIERETQIESTQNKTLVKNPNMNIRKMNLLIQS